MKTSIKVLSKFAVAGVITPLLLALTGCDTPEGTAAAGHLFNADAALASNPRQAAAWGLLGAIAGTSAQMQHEKEVAEAGRPQITINNTQPTDSSEQSGSTSWYDGKLTGGETYRGQVLNRYPHGSGQKTWPSGESYTGEFYQGYMHGRGTMIYKDGSKYEGEWRNGQRSGSGTFVGKSGYRYEGEWLSDKAHGKGTETSPDGTVFEGDFKDGRVFRGTATLPNGTVISGVWGDTNRGTIRYPDGRIYEGEWDGNPLPSSQSAPGSWTEERPNGLGCMTYPDGKKKDGLWRQGEYVGRVVKDDAS